MTPGRAGRALLPVVFFLVWAIAFTFPLALRLSDAVILARGGDAWLHIWDLWWANKSLVELHQSPYYTTMLYYPSGLNLYYHSLDIVNGIVSIPLQRLFGLTSAYNLLMLANLTLDGLAAYWLCLDRTKSAGASLVGGALFASAPLLGTSVNLGQLDEVTVWWIPLYVLALWRVLDSPGPVWAAGGGKRATMVAGICLAGAALATWYFAAGLAIFTLFFVIAYGLSKGNGLGPLAWWQIGWQAAGKVGAAWALFALMLSPLLWAMIRERLSGATYMLPALGTTIFNSVDVVGLFLPARAVAPSINGHGGNVALGYVAIVLSLLGLVVAWRKLWPLAVALVAVIIMSLGPELLVMGNNTGIPMPYALLNNVPFVGASRQPLRFLATAGMALSLLSAFGARFALDRFARVEIGRAAVRAASRTAILVTLALLALIVAELFELPRTMTTTQVGPAYTFLRDSAQPGAVMEVPVDRWAAGALLDQTVHGKPIVGGYTSRHFPYPLSALPVPGVSQLYGGDPTALVAQDILSPAVSETALAGLDQYNVRYVVAHKADLAEARYQGLKDALSRIYSKGDIVYDDTQVTVYKTPGSKSTLPLVGLGAGWYEPEGGGGPIHRWTNGSATVWLNIRAEGNYKLSATAYSYSVPRTLSITLDGRTLLQKQVGTGFQPIEVDLGSLAQGEHTILLQTREPPETPPGDNRPISLGFTRLAIQSR